MSLPFPSMAARTSTARKPAGLTRDLREDFALAMSTEAGNVDREAKVLKRVKMLGGSSPNSHDVDGVTGTDYLFEAVQRAASLYEGAPAFSNHPPRDAADQDRDIRDAMGIYHDVTAERSKENPALGELYGNLHLVPSHALTESMLDVASDAKLQGLYKLSHNARGTGEVKGGRYVITNINKARSCDVVDRGATTKNLFESQRSTMKTTLGKLLLESKTFLAGKAVKARLLEMDDLMGEEVPAEAPGDGDWKDHLVNAVGALVKSEDPADHAKAKKILAMLAPEAAEDLEEEDESEEDKKKREALEAEETDEDKKKKADDEKEVKESIAETTELVTLILPGAKIGARLIESIAKHKGKARMEAIRALKEAVGTAAPAPGRKPPPGAPRTATTLESAPADCSDLLTRQLY